jgi:hypothetical protein
MGEAYESYRQIMAAARRGVISPRSALAWAMRATRGEPVTVLASLSPPDEQTRRDWIAAAGPDLQARILDVLLRVADQVGVPTGDQVDGDLQEAWPPGTFGPTQEGYSPPVSWDGYVSASAGDLDDAETERLWPPATAGEADRRTLEDVAAGRARVEDWPDEALHELLFGNTTGPEAG